MKPRVLPVERIQQAIYLIRGEKVMLDSDRAEIYGVRTARLNEQVKRNRERFPTDFAFQLTREEFDNLMSQIATSKKGHGGRRKLPLVFTEHGALMLASVLKSDFAVQASLQIVRAFVQLRRLLTENRELAERLAELERKVEEHGGAIENIFHVLRGLLNPPIRRAGKSAFTPTKNDPRSPHFSLLPAQPRRRVRGVSPVPSAITGEKSARRAHRRLHRGEQERVGRCLWEAARRSRGMLQ